MNRSNRFPTVRCFAAHPTAISEAREFVRERAAEIDLPESLAEELVLAVSEACSNAVAHTDSLLVLVSWQVGLGDVEVQVQDDGVFQREIQVLPQLDREGAGIGIRLMMAMVDEFTIRQGTADAPGTLVRLRKNTGKDLPPDIMMIPDLEAPSPLGIKRPA